MTPQVGQNLGRKGGIRRRFLKSDPPASLGLHSGSDRGPLTAFHDLAVDRAQISEAGLLSSGLPFRARRARGPLSVACLGAPPARGQRWFGWAAAQAAVQVVPWG
jgi:hypothetical protein